MIATNNTKNKSAQGKLKNITTSFESIISLDPKSREKRVQRQIQAIKKFIQKSKEKSHHFSWSHCPWPVQFLPVITKFFTQLGKINAVNPGLSGMSGLMGMSKIEVNNRLNSDFRPRNIFCKKLPSTKKELEKKFSEKYDKKITFPVIIKPDIGERSTGVQFILEENIDNYLIKNIRKTNFIIEEFIPYSREFGLSWIREPNTKNYDVIAFTERITPRAQPDGKNSLEKCIEKRCRELSISHEKQAKIFAGFSKKELDAIDFKATSFVRTASISYGTSLKRIQLDTATKSRLSELISDLIIDNKGIHAGRFDIKANNIDELLAKKCSIIEMNGVAGAPLDIYDNEIPIPEKYEILFNYFDQVLAIAEKNIAKEKGIHISKITGIKELSRLFFGAKKTQELPASVWKNLREVFAIILQGRFKESSFGKLLKKIQN